MKQGCLNNLVELNAVSCCLLGCTFVVGCAGDEFVSSELGESAKIPVTAPEPLSEKQIPPRESPTSGNASDAVQTVDNSKTDTPTAGRDSGSSASTRSDAGSSNSTTGDAGARSSNSTTGDAGARSSNSTTGDAGARSSNSTTGDAGARKMESFGPIVPPDAIKLRLDVPCSGPSEEGPGLCLVLPEHDVQRRTLTLGGDPRQTYALLLRLRGFIEIALHNGGEPIGNGLHHSATVSTDGHAAYSLIATDPLLVYNLNARVDSTRSTVVDTTFSIEVKGGSALIFQLNAAPAVPDGQQRRNISNAIVPGDGLGEQPFDGQFLQLDILTAQSLGGK